MIERREGARILGYENENKKKAFGHAEDFLLYEA